MKIMYHSLKATRAVSSYRLHEEANVRLRVTVND